LPLEQVRLGLQARWGVPEDQARLLASISNGRPGYAVYLHQHPEQQEQRSRWLAEHKRLIQSGRVERFKFAESISKNKEALRGLLFVWLSLWRDVMLTAAEVVAPPANPDQLDEINVLAGSFGWQRASQVVAALENTVRLIDQNVNARLAFEVLLLEIPGL
jgi:DNA polymerase-3 subunit delta'